MPAARLFAVWAVGCFWSIRPHTSRLFPMTIRLHRGDLPDLSRYTDSVAVDTETMGLHPHRDRLCLVQLSAGDGQSHIVQLIPPQRGGLGFACPNLKRLLSDPSVVKLMHFGRFDVAVLQHYLQIPVSPVKCTK